VENVKQGFDFLRCTNESTDEIGVPTLFL